MSIPVFFLTCCCLYIGFLQGKRPYLGHITGISASPYVVSKHHVVLLILSCNSFAILPSTLILLHYLILCVFIHLFIVPTSVYFQFDVFHSEDYESSRAWLRVNWCIDAKGSGEFAGSSVFLDRIGACIPVYTASYPRRCLHQHCCNNLISWTFSILFVFLFVRPFLCMYSLTVVSISTFFPCFLKCKAQRKESQNYFEERPGRGYISTEFWGASSPLNPRPCCLISVSRQNEISHLPQSPPPGNL
jgi:hypothetical protein